MKAIGSSDAATGQFSSATGIIQRKIARVNGLLQVNYSSMGPLAHFRSNVKVIFGHLQLYFDSFVIDAFKL